MSNVKFKLDIKGLRELMQSAEMQDVLTEAGERVAAQGESLSGEPYKTRIVNGKFVSICQINPDSREGYIDTLDNNTALKALSSSGLPLDK